MVGERPHALWADAQGGYDLSQVLAFGKKGKDTYGESRDAMS
jgi:hypothetical protein